MATISPADASAAIETAIQALEGRLNARLDNLVKEVTAAARLSAQGYNCKLLDGSITPYLEVPFVDGSRPTQPPHNLPLLHSRQSIENLSVKDTVSYHEGYFPGINIALRTSREQRILALRRAVTTAAVS